MILFAVATLIPVPLFAAGAFLGGFWALASLAYIALFVFLLDEFIEHAVPDAPEGAEFPAADTLSVALGVVHFLFLPLALATLTGMTGLGWLSGIAMFLAFGMFFGQVSNSNAHELIHRADKRLFRLGMWVYISLLFGHHTSAHRHIHHRFVATPEDPNSAVMGDSFYAFAPHAWWGSFMAGAEMETALRKRAKGRRGLHPYVLYVGGALLFASVVLVVFGLGGLIAYLLLAGYAQVQLLLSDYVQHYGLERRRLPGGRSEPVGPAHSWNAGRWYSAALMLNAPRHSDHHAHPARPYPALTLPAPDVAPRLPFSLPVMGAIALYPPLWHRMMDKRARRWRQKLAARPLEAPSDEPDPLAAPAEEVEVEAPVATPGVALVEKAVPKEAPKPVEAQDDAAIADAVARTIALAARPDGKG